MLVQHSLCIFPLDLRIPGPEQLLICAYNLRRGLAFVCREEYLGEVERRLSLVKSEMEEEGGCGPLFKATLPFTRFRAGNTLRFHPPFRQWARAVCYLDYSLAK